MVEHQHDVIIADSDPAFRSEMGARLERAGFRPHAASTVTEVLAAVGCMQSPTVVLDARLDGGYAFELCRELRDRYGEAFSILLTSEDRTTSADRTIGLLIGADDYLCKPLDPDEFVARVRRASARAEYVMSLVSTGATPLATTPLTRREGEVLELLARGLRQAQIADALVVTEKTVSSHIQHILAKLGVHSRAEAVGLAFRIGLVPAQTGPGHILANQSSEAST